MTSEARGPSRARFQAAVRSGGTRRIYGHFATREERDAVVRQARSGEIEPVSELLDTEDIDDPVLLLYPTRRVTPERRLCAALIVNAWDDLRGGVLRRVQDTRVWVESRDKSKFSFEFCCDVIGRDADETRSLLLGGEAWQRGPSRRPSVARIGSIRRSSTASAEREG